MPNDLNTSIDFLKQRVDKTLSVQLQIAATWSWPLKTGAQWEADSLQLDKSQPNTLSSKAVAADLVANGTRGELDARLGVIHDFCLAAVGVMRVRAQRTEDLRPVVDELSARGQSRKEIEDEGTLILAAWEEEFGGAAFQPSPGVTFAGFEALFFGRPPGPDTDAFPSLRTLKQAVAQKATAARRETGRLNALLSRVERDCMDWYAEATAVFPAGTEIGDLIRADIPTTTDYGHNSPSSSGSGSGEVPAARGGATPPVPGPGA